MPLLVAGLPIRVERDTNTRESLANSGIPKFGGTIEQFEIATVDPRMSRPTSDEVSVTWPQFWIATNAVRPPVRPSTTMIGS